MYTFDMYKNKARKAAENLQQIELAAFDYSNYVNATNIELWDNLADLFCDMDPNEKTPPLVQKRTQICIDKLKELESAPTSKLRFLELLQTIFHLTDLLQVKELTMHNQQLQGKNLIYKSELFI